MAIQLEQLNYACCPVCRAHRRTATQGRQHANGQWNETLVFECGCRIEWTPNFSRERRVQQCPKHPEEALRLEKRNIAEAKLVKYIARMDVDGEFKEELTRYM